MTATTLAAGAHLGRYEIESLVGTGGMGEVYRARDTQLGRTVAIKVLPQHMSADAGRRQRFSCEARVLSNLSHAHIRALYDVGRENGIDFLVMEYLEGETLDHLLSRRPIPLLRAVSIAEQIADALAAAHRQGVIHGDIKPANIMLTQSGVKLLDFGVARLWHDVVIAPPPDAQTATDTTAIPGTTPYMSPEGLEGADADPRSDLFSLGVVLYEMLAGHRPFQGTTRARIIASILERDPEPLVGVHDPIPQSLHRAVMKCLAKDPEDRWQTARDLASELSWIARPEAARDLTPTARNSWKAAALIVAGAAAVLAVVWGATRVTGPAGAASPRSSSIIRFLADAPRGSTMTPAPGAFAVSPDGRRLAFVASAGSGARVLWLRELDSYEARPIRGTDDAWNPFWSPDGKTIAFRAGSHLRTVDTETQTVLTVCDLPGSRTGYGTWGARGDIIYTSERGLFKVAAAGGIPQTLALHEDNSRFESPEFLPDGEHFLFNLRAESPARSGIYIATRDGANRRRIVDADSQAIYADPGYLVYVKAGTLYAQPFDAKLLQIDGAPRVIPESVALVPAIARGAFSISRGNVLAYRAGVLEYELTWYDRAGRRLSTLAAPGPFVNPAISPDGTRVAVTRYNTSAGSSDIWVFDQNRGARQLTSADTVEDHAVWAPDGRTVAFISAHDGASEFYRKEPNAAASDPDDLVAHNSNYAIPMEWTRSGRLLYLLFERRGALGARFWTMPLEPAGDSLLLPSSAPDKEEGQGQVSPDGRWLAYVSDVTGSPQIYVRPFPSGSGRWLVSANGGLDPHWRGDGRELFYLAPDQTMMSVEISPGQQFQAADPRPLFRTSLVGAYLGAPFPNGRIRNEYAVSPDGSRFLISEPAGGTSAYAVRVLVNWPALLAGSR